MLKFEDVSLLHRYNLRRSLTFQTASKGKRPFAPRGDIAVVIHTRTTCTQKRHPLQPSTVFPLIGRAAKGHLSLFAWIIREPVNRRLSFP
jgi:hypothetical protein